MMGCLLKIRFIKFYLSVFGYSGVLIVGFSQSAVGETVLVGSVNVNSHAQTESIRADEESQVAVSTVRITDSHLANHLTIHRMDSQLKGIEAARGTQISVASLGLNKARIGGRTSLDLSVRANGVIRAANSADVQIGSFSVDNSSRLNSENREGGSQASMNPETPILPPNPEDTPIKPDRLILEYALLSRCAKDNCEIEKEAPGWRRISEIGVDWTGLDCTLFYNQALNQYVLAFPGTNVFSADSLTDINQAFTGSSLQYLQAIEVSKKLKESLKAINPEAELVFIGHSLGGGLASAASLVTNNKAVTFNAAGLHPRTVGMHGVSTHKAPDLIEAYYVKGEPLSRMQDFPDIPNIPGIPNYPSLPQAVGTRIRLDPPDDVSKLDLHGIDAVIQSLEKMG